MKTLDVLENKIAALVELVQTLKLKNSMLIEENASLVAKLEARETTMNEDLARMEKLDKETASAKAVIGGLIERIDSFIELENQ